MTPNIRTIGAAEANAIVALSEAFVGVATAAKSIAIGHAVGSEAVSECMGWTRDGLRTLAAMSDTTVEGTGVPEGNTEAITLAAETVDFLGQIMAALARGGTLPEGDAALYLQFAAAKLTELARLAPRPQFEAATAELWGWDWSKLPRLDAANATAPKANRRRKRSRRTA